MSAGAGRDPQGKALLRVLAGEALEIPPIWLMRQAGRYLPEYRAERAKVGGFLELCYTPEVACEVTLQPIRRYGFDAAIIFSDILVVPHALGQEVWFVEGEGPKLAALATPDDLSRLEPVALAERLAPVYEALRLTRAALPAETALIGFAGAPWTLACYMLEGGSPRSDFGATKSWAYLWPEAFQALVDGLVEAVAEHLCRQVEAGAEALQLFESHAGALAGPEFRRWCYEPLRAIAARVRERCPGVPILAFPRQAGTAYELFAEAEWLSGLSLDTSVDPAWARRRLPEGLALQGNLDPFLLTLGGQPLEKAARTLCSALAGRPFVFNLGHGITPQARPEAVAELVAVVRDR